MGTTKKEKLKEWFKSGAKPTQEQFYAWMDSYLHKDDDYSYILDGLEGYQYMGVATPDSVPPVPKQKVFYIANQGGKYPNYGGLVVADYDIALLCYNGSWSKMTIGNIATKADLNDNYRTKEELENVLGFETLSRVAGYSYVGIVNEETAKVVDIDGTSKVYYIVIAPIDYEVLFSGAKSEAKGYTYVKSVEGQWVVEDLGIPFDLQGSLDKLNTKDGSLETKISQVENTAKSKVAKQQSAGQGNVVMFGEGGEVADSNIEASNVAKQNGYYESMIVGASKNLAGSDVVTAKYTYRPTAGTADVADGVAKISSVKGNTIVWNQIAIMIEDTSAEVEQNGNSYIYTPNQIPTTPGGAGFSSGWATISTPFSLHKYYVKFKFTRIEKRNDIEDFTPQNVTVRIVDVFSLSFSCNIGESININHIFTISSLTSNKLFISLNDCICQIDNIQLFDLTQMFGEGNEPTIEEFEAMFPNDYYEYNEGELRSIEDFSIKSVGFNQWDEEWVEGDLNFDGSIQPNTTKHVTKNFIRVIPNKKYKITLDDYKAYYWAEFDNDFKNIKSENSYLDYLGNYKEAITFKGDYIKIVGPKDNQTMNINLSHSGIRDSEYEPYQEDILPINISTIKDENGEQLFPNGLCSAGEAHDELVYDKGIGKWKAVKRIGSVDLGTLNWYTSWYADSGRIYADLISKAVGAMNIIYPLGLTAANDNKLINSVGICGNASNTFIFIGQGVTHTDSAAFIASLNGIYTYYELAEAIEVVLDDFASNYQVSDWGTEEILMNSTPIVPVIYDVEYALNAVDTLRNMPTNYISKESLDAFLSALGTAMNGTWTATYNESNNRYDFTFSANTSTTELIEE